MKTLKLKFCISFIKRGWGGGGGGLSSYRAVGVGVGGGGGLCSTQVDQKGGEGAFVRGLMP